MKFKVGDRVSVYDHDKDLFGAKGTVYSAYGLGKPVVIVKLDKPNEHANIPTIYVNQCRRLVKKKRRRIWVYELASSFDETSKIDFTGYRQVSTREKPGWLEFVEVKRK